MRVGGRNPSVSSLVLDFMVVAAFRVEHHGPRPRSSDQSRRRNDGGRVATFGKPGDAEQAEDH
jgi:hypothetical protein